VALCDRHVALLGPGGFGKSSIAKAVLNEPAIVSTFFAHLFMSFENFVDRIGDVLGLSTSKERDILRRLESLLVIDNAEVFLGASAQDQARISELLETMGARTSTRILVTTRDEGIVPFNLVCERIAVYVWAIPSSGL